MGIKSFQGSRRAQQSQETEVNLKVSDYMSTELITFFPEQSVSEVIEKVNTISNFRSSCGGS